MIRQDSPRMHFAVRLVLLAVMAAAVCCAAQEGETNTQSEDIEAAKEKMPRLFDFDFFKQSFGKAYRTHVEELARKTLFMARAFKVFVSGVAYKFRLKSHYLAVNFMSDQTPSERSAARNKVMAGKAQDEASRLSRGGRSEMPAKEKEDQIVDPEPLERQIENDIKQVIDGEMGNKYADLLGGGGVDGKSTIGSESTPARRKKRSVQEKPREMSFKMLVKLPERTQESPEVRAKIKIRVHSNNPKYQQIEMSTQGLIDQQQSINKWKIARPEADSIFSTFKATLSYFFESAKSAAKRSDASSPGASGHLEPAGEEEEGEEDEGDGKLFVDHRKSGCLFAPRDQGKCGSCYAFAGIAYMEWLHCVKTGNLVAFSEQYMVDCGNMRVDGDALLGCEGAFLESVPKFFHNFGMELRANYPYKTGLHRCPYEDDTNLEATGYIRMPLGDFTEVPRSRWEEFLKFSPLYIGIATPEEFRDYGGGVDSGEGCSYTPDHAMLVVGHGRQDGQEYWLIRNSYSPGWGEMGYYKLSKKAPLRCIEKDLGWAYGTSDGKTFNVKPEENPLNDRSLVQRHYTYALNDDVLW